MKEFKEKVALVTGGASGIGFAMADRFASVGMKIVLADVEEAALAKAERTLSDKGAPVLAVPTDVSDPASVESLAEDAYGKFGAVHVLCNNAGVAIGGAVWSHSLEDWRWVLGVNLMGVVHGVRSFVPRMLAQGTEGHVVNTASVAGLMTGPYASVYHASKHAVVAMTECLKMELDMQKSLLSASVLCPGFVSTNIMDAHRNRPESLKTGKDVTAQEATMRELTRQLVTTGINPALVADMVLEAIRQDSFYILTHPQFGPMIRNRVENVLAGRTPRPEPLP